MAKAEKYNGWANYETWNVALWFGNDYGMYQAVKGHPKKFTAASAEEFTKELLPNGTPDFESRGGASCYAKVNWKEIAADFNEMRGDSGVKEAPSRGSLRTMEGMPLREMGNIYWRDIPTGTRVELVGHSYVVTLGNGEKKGAYWEGREAREAQRTLDRWVARGYSFGGMPAAAHEGVGEVVEETRVRAIRHPWGNGYAYVYRHNGETYSSSRRAPYPTADAAIKAGNEARAKKIEWDAAEPGGSARRPPLREHPYPPPRRPAARPLPRRR
jgi:hypothetical protein